MSFVKFEALTYSAASFEGGASAPVILGRSSGSPAALSPASNSSKPLSAAMVRFWFWMQMRFSALRDKAAREVCSMPSHIVHMPSTNPDAPRKAVRVNRAIMRRLRRLLRLREASYFDGPSVSDECARLSLTLRQYREYLIRCQGYSRVQMHGLGWGRHARMLRAILCGLLQGDAASLMRADICAARLSPD